MSYRTLFKEGNGIVYHYTGLDTLFKILDNVNNDNLVFHASEIFCMNDPTEFYHGVEQIWNVFPIIEKKAIKLIKTNNQFSYINKQYLDNKYMLSKIWSEVYKNKQDWFTPYIESIRQSHHAPFVISFSCLDDFLPMWENYGNNGLGVAIGIDIQEYYRKVQRDDGTIIYDFTNINASDIRSLLVSYEDLSTKHPLAIFIHLCIVNYYKELSQKGYDAESIFDLQFKTFDKIMMTASCLIKNKAYEYEQESRLMAFCNYKNDIIFKTTPRKTIIPYININIPISKLNSIVVGPCCDFPRVRYAIKTRLEQLDRNFNYENIIQSRVPYRVL